MLRIDNYIFSVDVIEKKFVCDLPACLGNCCRYGDSGAPLEPDEVKALEEIRHDVLPYMRQAGRSVIEEMGTSIRDFEGDMVTPLIDGAECAYTILNGNIFMCAIEKAWSEGKTGFRKPISCHLFPVRMKKFREYIAVNVEDWSICQSAREKGRAEEISVYEFLREPLIRAMGPDVYEQLCIAAGELKNNPVNQ